MARYRFHGQFVSESRAAQLSNLKNASAYLTSESHGIKREGYRTDESLARSAAREAAARERERESERRSEAARRGWETRRAREALPVPTPPPVLPPPEIEEEIEVPDIPGAEFLESIPEGATAEEIEDEIDDLFGGYEIDRDYADYEGEIIDLAAVDIENDRAYPRKK